MKNFLKNAWRFIIVTLGLFGSGYVAYIAHAQTNGLYECYQAKGLVWGTTSERRGTAESLGIRDYQGSASQNHLFAQRVCNLDNEPKLGAGYAPVTGYQAYTTSRVSASASTIPVTTVKDKAGNTIVPSSISSSSTVRMYFNFEPGTVREEPFYCTGISGLNLTGCIRGTPFQGGSLTSSSTIAQIHNAGAAIIMTNTGTFYANEIVGTTGDQDIYGFKAFKNATTTFGSGASGIVYFPSTGKLGYKNDSGSTFTFDAGSSGLTASTTKGIFIDGSQIGINASSTGGIAFDSSGKTYVNASTTRGLSYGTAGDVGVNQAFDFGWTGNSTFSGNNSFTATTTISKTTTPSFISDNEITNKLYQDLQSTSATGTTAVTVTAGQALYLTSTSTLALTSGANASSTYQFIGIAEQSASAGTVIRYTKPGGVNCNQSGLSAGTYYFLSDTGGALATTPGTRSARVGIAMTSACIQVVNPKFILTGSTSFSSVTSAFQYTGFYPMHIDIRAGNTSAGVSFGDDTNTCIRTSSGGSATTGVVSFAYSSFNGAAGTVTNQGSVSSKTIYGFTLDNTTNTGGATTNVYWTAYSE